MKCKIHRCHICEFWTARERCPVCGSIRIGKQHFTVHQDRMVEIVRGIPLSIENIIGRRLREEVKA